MGIFNGFIVIRMLLQSLTMHFFAKPETGKSSVCGVPPAVVLLVLAAISLIKLEENEKKRVPNPILTLKLQA